MVPHSEQHSEEEVELLPKAEHFFLFLIHGLCSDFFYCICSQHTASHGVWYLTSNVDGFGRAACAELAQVDGVAALLQSFLFPKSSAAILNFNNFRFVRFNPVL